MHFLTKSIRKTETLSRASAPSRGFPRSGCPLPAGLGLSLGVLTTIGLTLAPAPARAEFFLHRWENLTREKGELIVRPEFRLYSSGSNYDPGGSSFFPAQGLTGYSRTQFDLTTAWGAFGPLTVFSRLTWASVGIQTETQSYSVMGPADQTVGANVKVLEFSNGGSIHAQAQAELPAYDIAQSIAAKTPFLGDGSMDFTGGAFVYYPLSAGGKDARFAAEGGLGFTYRTAGFSAAIPWSAGLRFRAEPARGFFAEVGGRGIVSLGTDATQLEYPRCTRDPSTGQMGTAGSCFNFAVNPSLSVARGLAGYRFGESLSVHLELDMPVFGYSAPQGLQMAGGVEIRLGGSGKEAPKVRNPELSKANDGFVTYALQAVVTGVNDRLSLVKIDKGSQQGVVKGQVFDIFSVSKDGSISEAVARAAVTELKLDEAVLKITEYFREVWIEEGFVVKRPLK